MRFFDNEGDGLDLEKLTTPQKPLQKPYIGTWHWAWYVWSVDIIYRFFDGNTGVNRWNVEQQMTSKCYYWTISRFTAIAVLGFQAVVLAALIASLTWLPVMLFGVWEYVFTLRMIGAAISGIIGVVATLAALWFTIVWSQFDNEDRLIASIIGIIGLLVSRILFWEVLGTPMGDHLGNTAIMAGILGASSIAGFIYFIETRPVRQEVAVSSAEEVMIIPDGPVEREERIGFFKALWLMAKYAKSEVCPIIQPVRPGEANKREVRS